MIALERKGIITDTTMTEPASETSSQTPYDLLMQNISAASRLESPNRDLSTRIKDTIEANPSVYSEHPQEIIEGLAGAVSQLRQATDLRLYSCADLLQSLKKIASTEPEQRAPGRPDANILAQKKIIDFALSLSSDEAKKEAHRISVHLPLAPESIRYLEQKGLPGWKLGIEIIHNHPESVRKVDRSNEDAKMAIVPEYENLVRTAFSEHAPQALDDSADVRFYLAAQVGELLRTAPQGFSEETLRLVRTYLENKVMAAYRELDPQSEKGQEGFRNLVNKIVGLNEHNIGSRLPLKKITRS